MESKYFPFKSVDLCLWCYEEKHNKKLRSLRKILRLASDFKVEKNTPSYHPENKNDICSFCGDTKIKREGAIYVCLTCNSEVSVKSSPIKQKINLKAKKKEQLDKKQNDNSKISKKETKKTQIIKACKNHLSLIMTYKGIHRIVYPYACNDIYCVAYCTYRNELRTFRIDRMKSLQNGNSFNFKNSLYHEAQEKVNNVRRFY